MQIVFPFLMWTLMNSMTRIWFYQEAQQERTTFVSSLLPLLAEYSLQPPVPDAQSIISNVKVRVWICGFEWTTSVLYKFTWGRLWWLKEPLESESFRFLLLGDGWGIPLIFTMILKCLIQEIILIGNLTTD